MSVRGRRPGSHSRARRQAWRLAFRMARRDLLRAKKRSALVASMIGLPVLLVAATLLLARTGFGDDAGASALRTMGPADALVSVQDSVVSQDFTGDEFLGSGPVTDPSNARMTPSRIAALTGGEVLPIRAGTTLVRTGLGAVAADVRQFDLRDPRVTGLGTITDGRAPRTTDEVAVSARLADEGFEPGRSIHLGTDGQTRRRVVGVVRNPADLKSRQVVGLPGSVPATGAGKSTDYLVDTGGSPITWSKVRELNTHGLLVRSRAVIEHPPPAGQLPQDIVETSGSNDTAMVAFTVVVTACVLLEVVLLAGPAFAVGARRQRRQFALFVATGGTPRDVRRLMLAQAGLLGFGSALAGNVVAIAVVAATLPWSSRIIGRDIAPLRIAPLDLAGLLLLGTLAALAAAYVPARQAARQDTIEVLAGRRGTTRTRRGWPLAGVALMGAGACVAVVLGHRSSGEYYVVGGMFALVAGAIMVTPAVVGGVGRFGGRLPLSLRMAARDSSRNRSRTTPAVAAIMGVVAGVTALAIGSASDFEQNRRDYRPQASSGTMVVYLGDDAGRSSVDVLTAQIRTEVPGSAPAALWHVPSYPVGGTARVAVVLDPACRSKRPLECQAQPDVPDVHMSSVQVEGMLVADARTVARAAGKAALTPRQRDVLAAGGVLVPYGSALRPDGTVEVATFTRRFESSGADEAQDVHRQRLPAAVLRGDVRDDEYSYLSDIVATPATAKRLGLEALASKIVVTPGARAISHEQEDRVAEIARGLSGGSSVYVERGFVETYTVQFLGIAILGGLLVLVGVATATALALDDARPDFATLAAVGASPRTRRRMAMAQAGVISVLGAAFGVVVGAAPGLAITWPLTAGLNGRTSPIIDIPWALLGLVIVGVPALAILGAGLLTTSKIPMIRRAE